MTDHSLSPFEERLRLIAAGFPYPDSPRLHPALPARRRILTPRLSWALAVLGVLVVAVLSVPVVRARVFDFFQVGAVRIRLGEPDAAATPAVVSLLDLAGETTLEEARAAFGRPIPLPAYPPDLGPPHRVFLQHHGAGKSVVLAWLDPVDPPRVRLALYVLAPGVVLYKGPLPNVVEVDLHGIPAYWTDGPYLLAVGDGFVDSRLVSGHALIWESAGLTYRLETDSSLEQALEIAASLR